MEQIEEMRAVQILAQPIRQLLETDCIRYEFFVRQLADGIEFLSEFMCLQGPGKLSEKEFFSSFPCHLLV